MAADGRGRPKLAVDPRRAIVALRRRRVPVKEIADDLGVSERAVRNELAAFKREAPLRQSSALPWRKPRPNAFDTVKGQARLHFAERVVDLAELCRVFALEDRVTVATLMRILSLEESSALHAFYAMRDQFAVHGIAISKEAELGALQGDAVIVFDRQKAEAFVKRELPAAEKLLTEWKEKRGTHERFRGRKT